MTSQADKVPLWLKWQLYREAVQSRAIAGSAGALTVLFWLLEDYDRDGTRVCAPSLDRLAGLAQTSRRTVVTVIDKLVAEGFVRRLEKGGGRYRSTHYAFPWIEARMDARAKDAATATATQHDTSHGRKTGAPASQKRRRSPAETPQTVSPGSQNTSSCAQNCEDNCEAARSDTVNPTSQDSRDSQNPENPSSPARHPQAQRHFLLPIQGEAGKLDRMVARRFRISHDDASDLVRAWLKQTDADTLHELLVDAAAQGISRDDLPGFVQRRLRNGANAPAAATGQRHSPGPSATGSADDDPAWQRVRSRVCREIGEAAFTAWLANVGYDGCQDDTAVLIAPSRHAAEWVRGHYADRLRAAWQAEAARVRAVRIQVAAQAATG